RPAHRPGPRPRRPGRWVRLPPSRGLRQRTAAARVVPEDPVLAVVGDGLGHDAAVLRGFRVLDDVAAERLNRRRVADPILVDAEPRDRNTRELLRPRAGGGEPERAP